MKRILHHLTKRKKFYLEIALAAAIILCASIFYHYEENNFEAYLADRFPSQGLSLAQVISVNNGSVVTDSGTSYITQDIIVQFLTGDMKGQTTTVSSRSSQASSTSNNYLQIEPGEKVL